MKRKAAHLTAPRSFLRQLAEPMPAAAAHLTPPRPTSRGAVSHALIPTMIDSTSDARLPSTKILDATGTPGPFAAGPRATQRSKPTAPAQPIEVSRPIEANTLRAPSARQNHPASSRTAHETHSNDSILQSTLRDRTTAKTTTHPATPNTAALESTRTYATSSQPASPLSQTFPQPTKSERRPDISIHIGTIEVRVPPPPARTPPAPTALNSRSAQRASASSRAAEPLARSLAWSHGLVQG